MEQGQCWMQTKRKFSEGCNPSYDESSWEEQAFAEDAASGSLGGCIWPPRSYSCSFCRREFRSAQALGGHMNVHRRDRARLKQPSSPKNEILYHEVETQDPFTSIGFGLGLKTTNPNSFLASPPSSSSKALPSSSILNMTNSYDPWSNLAGDHRLHPSKYSKGFNGNDNDNDNDNDETGVAMSVNLVVCRTQQPLMFETKEEDIRSKKRKKDASSIPFFPNSSSDDRHHHLQQQQVFEISPSSIDELDLELRLGNRSKV